MSNNYKKVKQWYDAHVEEYAKRSAVLLLDELNVFLTKVRKGGRILDAGCGPGHDTEYFARKGFQALGVDFSSKMIDYAKRNRNVGVFKKVNLLELDRYFDKAYFDGVWVSSSLTHFKKGDIVKVLKQIKFVTAPKSPIVIIVKKKRRGRTHKREIIFNEFYKKDIVEYIRKSGLVIKKIKTFSVLNSEWFFIYSER